MPEMLFFAPINKPFSHLSLPLSPLQLQRQKHIIDKIIHNIPDQDDDALGKNVKIDAEYIIRITDDDPL